MAYNDLVIPNQSRTNLRLDIQDALQALGSVMTGPVGDVVVMYPNQLQADTTSGYMLKRNNANNAWDYLFPLDQRIIASTEASDNYVIALAPPINAYKDSCIYKFEADEANTGPATLNINGVGAWNIKKISGGTLVALTDGDIPANGICYCYVDTTASAFVLMNPSSKGIMQIVNALYTNYAYTNSLIPFDNTIPQITEGEQFMALAITPKNANSILKIDVVFIGGSSADGRHLIIALFQDSIANALAAALNTFASLNFFTPICFSFYMTSGGVSEITFKVRAGLNNTGYALMNGPIAGGLLGGVLTSSITITEIL